MQYSEEVLKKAKKAVEIGNAILEGKKIEFYVGNLVFALDKEPSLNFAHNDYRVKPEPKYIPFTFEDAKDLIGKVVKRKKGNFIQTIVQVTESYVFAGVGQMDYKFFLENCIFLDGTPCGKIQNT